MIDIKWVRDHPEALDENLKKRGMEPFATQILAVDEARRTLLTNLQELQSERNVVSKAIGMARSKGENVDDLQRRAAEVKEKLPALDAEAAALDERLQDMLSRLPNLLADDVPNGRSETDNQLIRTWGEPKSFSFDPKRHFELGEALGLMDFETAARMAGARFVVLKGALARLERALAQFMLDLHTGENGYLEVNPPYLVRTEAVFGTAQLPKFAEDLFQTTDDRWLISTSEISLTNLVRESILKEEELPRRFVSFTPCFRSEAGAAGKDTRGMIRQHQFHKVELVSITRPDQSREEHERMTRCAETVLQRLELPYRVMLLCSGDTGSGARKTYDLEVWLPGEGLYREISSCSNCGDYQARRMAARFRPEADGKAAPEFVHTLNGSGIAVGRALVAVLENYQQEDGSILIPQVLRSYMNGLEKIHAHE